MSVAIITGASKGLGCAPAAALAERGWDLVLDARSAAPLGAAAKSLRETGARVVDLPGDVTDAGHRAALVGAAGRLGGLDLLVNNASALGAEPLVRLAEQPLDGLRSALETNVVAPLGLVQEALPLLRGAAWWCASRPGLPTGIRRRAAVARCRRAGAAGGRWSCGCRTGGAAPGRGGGGRRALWSGCRTAGCWCWRSR
ncbi:SDR family NAD(P)-dependent oxidoreductase [Streptomyces sp. H27-D2]|uniref:SDR family NAD(P)-dependent oxidoreductase n=1 Tax=Streptomyces sp. H27-D2 TaxID=3046304 RepID=UPI002DB5726E|nr:SDR family NAD(P)-dependent oxidoreductase [Streptomyces sp. H27-D2]MEC4020903.1 SDR family NAD(P)-dependent oxidoreductase [Streptomyces sp. H27-D2]